MARVSDKITVEEKGQRAARSTNVYMPKLGLKEAGLCGSCGAMYHNKRWVMDEAELLRLKGAVKTVKLVCPACQRMEDSNPAGILTLSGDYLLQHEEDILNAIKRGESKSRIKNPLGRIMEITQNKGVITISTTEDKLAQKLGREIYKAHRGELHYQWSHEQSFVRVNWRR